MHFGDLVGDYSHRGISGLTHCVDLIFFCVSAASLWVMQALHCPPPSVGFRRTSWKRQHILERQKLASESIKALSRCSFVYIYMSCWFAVAAQLGLLSSVSTFFNRSHRATVLPADSRFLITSSRLPSNLAPRLRLSVKKVSLDAGWASITWS